MGLLLSSVTLAQLPAPAAAPSAAVTGEATVERVVVTGSNIPTAEETGPNPVDTYRPADIQRLGIRNAQDLQTFLPQEAGGTSGSTFVHSSDLRRRGDFRFTCDVRKTQNSNGY